MSEQQPSGSSLGCLVRLFWMVLGNCALALCLIGIVQEQCLSLGVLDAIFWLTVASLLIVRYVDVRHLGGTTTDGQPATMRDYWRYAGILLGVSLAAWLAAYAWVRFVVQP